MSNQVFQQNLDDKKGPQPGGPYLIQMLFKELSLIHISTPILRMCGRNFITCGPQR